MIFEGNWSTFCLIQIDVPWRSLKILPTPETPCSPPSPWTKNYHNLWKTTTTKMCFLISFHFGFLVFFVPNNLILRFVCVFFSLLQNRGSSSLNFYQKTPAEKKPIVFIPRIEIIYMEKNTHKNFNFDIIPKTFEECTPPHHPSQKKQIKYGSSIISGWKERWPF